MTELENLLNAGGYFGKADEKQRASQVLRAVEGLSIWDARELLRYCAEVLELLEIHYKCPVKRAHRVFAQGYVVHPGGQAAYHCHQSIRREVMSMGLIARFKNWRRERVIQAAQRLGLRDPPEQKRNMRPIRSNDSLEACLASISPAAQSFIEAAYGNIREYLTTRIEAEVRAQKQLGFSTTFSTT